MKGNKNIQRLVEPGAGVYLFFLLLFAAATMFFKMYYLAAAEGVAILVIIVYVVVLKHKKAKELAEYIESVKYDTENAKSNTLMNFPLPIAVFRMDDYRIIWGNDIFFEMCASDVVSRLDASISDLVPDFSGKWLMEGKKVYPSIMEIDGKKYQLHGKIIRSDKEDETTAFMGIGYFVDVTDYDNIRLEYENSRPVPGIVVVDNMEELFKNLTERDKNDIREHIDDKLSQWCSENKGILRRYDRDRYMVVFEKRYIREMKVQKFPIVEEMHQIESPAGINATISISLGEDSENMIEGMQFADMGVELALSRGGDQVVIKNKLSFEFFGGRGYEVEKRTKVRSRVMANTLAELLRDSSQVLVMGHRFADLDAVGAAVGVCCLSRKCAVKANIVIDVNKTAAGMLIDRVRETEEYKDVFISPQEALLKADGHTLLVVVDTNRPEQVEYPDLLSACNRVAVIDHHRVAATYIQNAALGFIEPYASSACELLTEILQEVADESDILKIEAEAMLSGIVLDTKSFSIRTGERTFDAASYLRRIGADTAEVKKLFQTDMEYTISKYKILQSAKLYRSVAVAAPEEAQDRVVAAQAADELLNISGVTASVVVVPNGRGGAFISARSIGEINVQILMEKLGGGGNRSAAAAQLEDTAFDDIIEKVYAAINEYLG